MNIWNEVSNRYVDVTFWYLHPNNRLTRGGNPRIQKREKERKRNSLLFSSHYHLSWQYSVSAIIMQFLPEVLKSRVAAWNRNKFLLFVLDLFRPAVRSFHPLYFIVFYIASPSLVYTLNLRHQVENELTGSLLRYTINKQKAKVVWRGNTLPAEKLRVWKFPRIIIEKKM